MGLKILNDVTQVLSHTANGDLRPDFILNSDDAFGKLAAVSNKIQKSLRCILEQIQTYIGAISGGDLIARVNSDDLSGAYARILDEVQTGFEHTVNFIDNIPNAFVILDKSEALIYQNRKAATLFGVSEKKIFSGMSQFDAADRSKLTEALHASFATSERIRGEIK